MEQVFLAEWQKLQSTIYDTLHFRIWLVFHHYIRAVFKKMGFIETYLKVITLSFLIGVSKSKHSQFSIKGMSLLQT